MTFRHVRTDDPNNRPSDSRTRLLERLLARHAADGFDVIELRRQMGKAGYVATEHRWEDDGDGEQLTDEDGNVLLIAGMSPAELAAEMVEIARQHAEEAGERKNYRVVALRNVEGDGDDGTQEEAFRCLLPASMFSGLPDESSGPLPTEHHDALMAANNQLSRQNDGLFRMLMEVVRQYPTVLSKSTELLEQLGDQLGGGRQHDLQQVMSILEFESNRDLRWMDHDRAKQRAGHRADLLGKSVEMAGPDLMTLLRRLVETLMSSNAAATGPQASAAAPETAGPTTAPPQGSSTKAASRSAYAKRLDDALQRVPAEGVAKARKLLDDDEWSLIEAARRAESDEEFTAILGRLRQLWTTADEATTQARMKGLIEALGMPAAMTLGQLVRETQDR